jgi:hypothetical protein
MPGSTAPTQTRVDGTERRGDTTRSRPRRWPDWQDGPDQYRQRNLRVATRNQTPRVLPLRAQHLFRAHRRRHHAAACLSGSGMFTGILLGVGGNTRRQQRRIHDALVPAAEAGMRNRKLGDLGSHSGYSGRIELASAVRYSPRRSARDTSQSISMDGAGGRWPYVVFTEKPS